MKKKMIIAVNSTFNLINHRVGLINGLLDQGYEVVALSPTDQFSSRLHELGCQHIPLQMERKGTNIVIGWTGTVGSKVFIDAFIPVLEKLYDNVNINGSFL